MIWLLLGILLVAMFGIGTVLEAALWALLVIAGASSSPSCCSRFS